jgi:hypothetical protein
MAFIIDLLNKSYVRLADSSLGPDGVARVTFNLDKKHAAVVDVSMPKDDEIQWIEARFYQTLSKSVVIPAAKPCRIERKDFNQIKPSVLHALEECRMRHHGLLPRRWSDHAMMTGLAFEHVSAEPSDAPLTLCVRLFVTMHVRTPITLMVACSEQDRDIDCMKITNGPIVVRKDIDPPLRNHLHALVARHFPLLVAPLSAETIVFETCEFDGAENNGGKSSVAKARLLIGAEKTPMTIRFNVWDNTIPWIEYTEDGKCKCIYPKDYPTKVNPELLKHLRRWQEDCCSSV